MSLNSIAIANARRHLSRRLAHFLDSVESEARPLTQWETDLLCRALALLETGLYSVGEDIMFQVERPDAFCTDEARAAVADGPTLTVAEVRASLAKVVVVGE